MNKNPPNNENITLEQISLDGRLRLLDMAYARLKFGFMVMPFISMLFAWYYSLSGLDAWYVQIWAVLCCAVSIIVFFVNKHYQRATELSTQERLQIWQPRIQNMAALYGVELAVLCFVADNNVSIAFKYLYLSVVACVMAGNATHQAPMLSVFNRFLLVGWGGTVLLMFWFLSEHWYFAVPLSIIYAVGLYRHALISHRFFVRMVWLEEESTRLAHSYKEAKDRAEQALAAKNQFLTTASHDLRQPVHAMGFLIESIAYRNQDTALSAPLHDLKQSVKVLTHMFNALLSLSKIELGVAPAHLEAVSTHQLMDEMMVVFGEEAASRGLQLRVWHSTQPAIVWADAIMLRQSMSNLIHNALRYTKRGGVLMGLRRRGDAWQFEVWDTGIGVALEEQRQVYSPFFRNQHAWQIDSAGHGLGLAVVVRCADLMGATYGLTSKEGRGSRFWLRLPAVSGGRVEVNAERGEPILQPFLGGRCLLIDDDPQVCTSWQLLLTSWGVETRCVASGLLAMQTLDDGFKPQAIFCDQRLRAGESGIEVLRLLLERCPEANGAMVSGEHQSMELRQAEDEGYIVLYKPLDVRVLHQVLSRWLDADNRRNVGV